MSHQHLHFYTSPIQHVQWFGVVVIWIVKAGGCEVRFNPLLHGPCAGPSLPTPLASWAGPPPAFPPSAYVSSSNTGTQLLLKFDYPVKIIAWFPWNPVLPLCLSCVGSLPLTHQFSYKLLPVTEPGALGKWDWLTFLPGEVKQALKFAG